MGREVWDARDEADVGTRRKRASRCVKGVFLPCAISGHDTTTVGRRREKAKRERVHTPSKSYSFSRSASCLLWLARYLGVGAVNPWGYGVNAGGMTLNRGAVDPLGVRR